jgi:hypothetical protein
MNTSFYGNKTKAKDGFEYSSRFEAEFVDKFLIPHNIEYERQKLYSEDSKHRCDFYLPDYDLWIECVYTKYVPKKEYTFGNGDIPMSIPWSDERGRKIAKSAGARWNRVTKKWTLPKSMVDPNGHPSLEKYMKPELLVTRYDPNQVSLTETYNLNLKNKLLTYGDTYTIIQVNYEDLKKRHLSDIIRVKNNSLFLKLLSEQPHLVPIREPKTSVSEVPNEVEPVKLDAPEGSAIISDDGTVSYVPKKQDKSAAKSVLKGERLHTFTKLIHGSSTEELREFERILTKMLRHKDWKLEMKRKEFPDK